MIILVAAVLLLGGAVLYGYLTVKGLDSPAPLMLFLGGALILLRTALVQEENLGITRKVGQKADTNQELLETIKGAIEDGHRNMEIIDRRFSTLEKWLTERTARFERIEDKLDTIEEKIGGKE